MTRRLISREGRIYAKLDQGRSPQIAVKRMARTAGMARMGEMAQTKQHITESRVIAFP